MANTWGAGWRKLVEWDSENKVYLYKGHEIIPLTWEERSRMPEHLQHQHYWGDIMWIDKIIEDQNRPRTKETSSWEEGFNQFWEYVNQ